MFQSQKTSQGLLIIKCIDEVQGCSFRIANIVALILCLLKFPADF